MSERIQMITHWKVVNLINELENGNLRIPRFQRDYVWEPSKVVKLLNSMYKEYPIGTFFLWETDRSMECFCRKVPHLDLPDRPEAGRFSFILDGQQRITSLYVGLKGKAIEARDYSKICFNIYKKEFRIPRPRPEAGDIPVYKLYDTTESQKLIAEYSTTGRASDVPEIINCSTLLRQYPLSVIKSLNMGIDEVVEIFERINQGGKRLTLFDLVHASVWSADFDLREKIEEVNDEPAIKLFGEISVEIFTQSLALNISNDCTNRHQLELSNQDCRTHWKRTVECIRLAVDFIKNFGVQQMAIIPYPSLLAIIQHYFFVADKDVIVQDDKSLISDWFWTATFSQRYSSSALSRMNEDAAWIRDLVGGNKAPRVFAVKLTLSDLRKARMNQRSVIKNGILCIMAMNAPVDFDNGDVVTLDKTNASRANSKENHHFFPYSLYGEFALTKNDINSVLNFAFISKRLNGEILNKKPSVYLVKYEAANLQIGDNLKLHYIMPDAFAAAKRDDFETFISIRGTSLLYKIEELCRVNGNVETLSAATIDADEDADEES